ncbi:hypothetical protein BDV36DRAFT_293046 [Aspergillus pseudocaelatus]|uniref:Uncharacterized protein n=1 Tax=Aspergillus pseudocaelatus TaxID=1825620 RepID=A0ABQ6WU36_9EURO|nr:hypothetical protein BDV36DRAFT_293046 [Aspergillus pseudocaelatus]
MVKNAGPLQVLRQEAHEDRCIILLEYPVYSVDFGVAAFPPHFRVQAEIPTQTEVAYIAVAQADFVKKFTAAATAPDLNTLVGERQGRDTAGDKLEKLSKDSTEKDTFRDREREDGDRVIDWIGSRFGEREAESKSGTEGCYIEELTVLK